MYIGVKYYVFQGSSYIYCRVLSIFPTIFILILEYYGHHTGFFFCSFDWPPKDDHILVVSFLKMTTFWKPTANTTTKYGETAQLTQKTSYRATMWLRWTLFSQVGLKSLAFSGNMDDNYVKQRFISRKVTLFTNGKTLWKYYLWPQSITLQTPTG